MKKLLVTLIGAISVAACGAASAAGETIVYDTSAFDALPWYVSGKAGVALPGTITSTTTFTGFGPVQTGSGDTTFDPGIAGAVSVGKYFTPELRGELEVGFASNAGRSFKGTDVFGNPSEGTLSGNVNTTTLMIAGYYDFTQFGDFVPHLSAGLGLAHVTSNLTYTETVGFGSAPGTITGSSTVPAARLGAGFEYHVSDAITFSADYTLIVGGDTSFTHTPTAAPANTSTVSSRLMSHAIAAGFTAKF